MSFFAELKRRNVFRVGIAYAVAAWLLLQFTEVLSELLNLPEQVGPVVVAVVAICFPLALFFAWAFELTPEGLKREHEVDRTQSITPHTGRKLDRSIIVMLVLALAYFIWESRFSGRTVVEPAQVAESSASQPSGDAEPAEPVIDRQSIAVLPFDNRSRLEEDEFFVEGVHDDLLTNLARIGELKVISRTSVLRYKDTNRPIPEIAEELGVATVMEGAVQRSGNTVRINVQLIDAQTDEHLWAEIFDRELTAENLFAIQSEISKKIADALEATLTDAEQDRIARMPTDNLEAYDAFVRGRQLMATRESAKLEEAIEEFKRAVELDPDFALAWVGVADSHKLFQIYGTFDFMDALAIREEAINRALEIDPDLGEAYTSRADILEDKREFEKSEEAFKKAIELSPNYATTYHWYSIALERYPLRSQERTDLIRRGAELDPRSAIVGVALAAAYEAQGLYSRAERQYLKVLDLEPGFSNAMGNLAGLYNQMSRFADAMKWSRRASDLDPGNPGLLNQQAFIYLQLGETEKADELLARLEEMNPERIGNGFINMWSNMVRGNIPGAREAAQWIVPRMREIGAPLYFMGNLELLEGNYQKARDYYVESEPGWTDPDQWQELISRTNNVSCTFAWVLTRTGDEHLGRELLAQALKYLTEDLPGAIEHADNQGAEVCYLTMGDTEAAYALMETWLDHNHLGFWREFSLLPMFDPIRHDERFHGILTEHDRRIAEQRDLVAKLDEGLAL